MCIEEALKYGTKRKTFGKRLVDHPVIRLKLAHMVRQVEATHVSHKHNISFNPCRGCNLVIRENNPRRDFSRQNIGARASSNKGRNVAGSKSGPGFAELQL